MPSHRSLRSSAQRTDHDHATTRTTIVRGTQRVSRRRGQRLRRIIARGHGRHDHLTRRDRGTARALSVELLQRTAGVGGDRRVHATDAASAAKRRASPSRDVGHRVRQGVPQYHSMTDTHPGLRVRWTMVAKARLVDGGLRTSRKTGCHASTPETLRSPRALMCWHRRRPF